MTEQRDGTPLSNDRKQGWLLRFHGDRVAIQFAHEVLAIKD
jgi:hypothetical protein